MMETDGLDSAKWQTSRIREIMGIISSGEEGKQFYAARATRGHRF